MKPRATRARASSDLRPIGRSDAFSGKVLTFADGLPPARSPRDLQLRELLRDGDPSVSSAAALELGAAYTPASPKAAAALLLQASRIGPPVTAGRALLRLARLAHDTEPEGKERADTMLEYLGRAQEVTSCEVSPGASLDSELLALRIDIASGLALLMKTKDGPMKTLLDVEGILRRHCDPDEWGAPQKEPFRRLAALVSLRLGEMHMDSNPAAADGHLERAVMLGTGSLQARAALERGHHLANHAGGLGPEIERQYMLAIDLGDSYATPRALIAMGDILRLSGRTEKAEAFWTQATELGDREVLERVGRRQRGAWREERAAAETAHVDDLLNHARPRQELRPATELGRVASGWAPDAAPGRSNTRIIVVGAGTGGHYLLPALRHDYRIVGFVDDDRSIRSVRGIPVLGTTAQLGAIIDQRKGTEEQVDQVIFAIPTAPGKMRLRVLNAAHRQKVQVLTLPTMFELRYAHSLLAQLRPFEVQELYGDQHWHIDREAQNLVRDRRVAVIGAGTVLGAEVARRVAYGQPRHLLVVDDSSGPLMRVAGEIRKLRGLMDCEARIVDYTAAMELTGALDPIPEVVLYCGGALYAPESVLAPAHAARVNVLAAATVAGAAQKAGCEELVMASADRAGHRSIAFDMTKALAEVAALLYASTASEGTSSRSRPRLASRGGGLRVSVLRLPNLWARDGSVVGRLTEQLRHGGPLEVKSGRKRRFAPTWHAAQTMLRLLDGDHRGGIFALQQGDTVEVRELAERLLLIHDLEASDIQIVSTTRPDEKASLSLWGSNETPGSTDVKGTVEIRQQDQLRGALLGRVGPLLDALRDNDPAGVRENLRPIDPVSSTERNEFVA